MKVLASVTVTAVVTPAIGSDPGRGYGCKVWKLSLAQLNTIELASKVIVSLVDKP